MDAISELGALLRSDPAAVTLCVESEFDVRDDGLLGMEQLPADVARDWLRDSDFIS